MYADAAGRRGGDARCRRHSRCRGATEPVATRTSWTPRSSTRTRPRGHGPVTDRPRDEHGPSDEHGQPEERRVRSCATSGGSTRRPGRCGSRRQPAGSRRPGVPNSPADGPVSDVGQELSRQIAERTADLQRLQAEYANYRRRVDRDRAGRSARPAVADVLANCCPVLDDIGRAREHGELEGGFKSVGEALEADRRRSSGSSGSATPGEPFDPKVHEALTHAPLRRRHRADLRRGLPARLPHR